MTNNKSNNIKNNENKFTYYGWLIVALSFLTLSTHGSARMSFSLFQVALIDEYGWSRGALGGAFSLMMVLYALIGPFIGSFFEKYGARSVIPLGSIIIGIGLSGGYFISEIWHVYFLIGIFLSIGQACSGFAMHSALMPLWFQKKRGLATGIVFSGPGIGAIFLIPALEYIMRIYGWRNATLFFGLLLLLIIGPSNFIFMRNKSKNIDFEKENEKSKNIDFKKQKRTSISEILRVVQTIKISKQFWILGFMNFSIGIFSNTIISQLQIYMIDVKYSMSNAAIILGMSGFFRITGSLFSGWISDLIGRKYTMAIVSTISLSSVVLLILIPFLEADSYWGYLFAIIFGIGGGGLTSCYAAQSADTFQGKQLGIIMGLLQIFYGAGGATGPLLAGFNHDMTGNYMISFIVLIIMLTGMILGCFSLSNLSKK